MKTTTILSALALLGFCQAHAQDVIVKRNGETIPTQITNANLEHLYYRNADDPEGSQRTIAKTEVTEVRFASGKTEYFGKAPAANTTSMEETRQFIIDKINKHGFDPDSFKRHYRASFEGDHLRLTILNKKGEPTSHSELYDFSNVFRFSGVDRRTDQVAYINIYVAALENEKKNRWAKSKITMLVDGDIHAESIFSALKHYNALLLQREKGDSKF